MTPTEECVAVIMADSDFDMSDSDAKWSGDNEDIEAVGLNEVKVPLIQKKTRRWIWVQS